MKLGRQGFSIIILLTAFGLVSCSSDNNSDATAAPPAPEYMLTAEPYTSLQRSWAPIEPTAVVRSQMNDGGFTVYQHERYDDQGLGVALRPGIPWIEHLELAPGFPGEGLDRRSLSYLWVAADPQIIDEESPIRLDGFALLYRPNGPQTIHVFEAHVRTARRISDLSGRPFEFALLAGDLTDSTQQNELDWMITALNGGIIDPDSGVDDDPVPGEGNDFNDPFYSTGLNTPWYAAIGNHDVLHIGGFGSINESLRESAVGDRLNTVGVGASLGGLTRGDMENYPTVFDDQFFVAPDPRRLTLYKREFLQILHDADGQPVGHGLTQENVDNERAYFSVQPVADRPVKIIVLDTNAQFAVGGTMDAQQLSWLHEELVSAASKAEIVIVVSHHRLEDFATQSEVSAETIRTLLASSENVLLHLTGHGHANTKVLEILGSGNGYWELMTASTIDFPLQSRIIELVDEQNGYLSIYVTNVEHNSAENTPAYRGRQLAAGKLAFGFVGYGGDTEAFWAQDTQAQNLLLRIRLPASLRDNLASLPNLPSRIESVETLANF